MRQRYGPTHHSGTQQLRQRRAPEIFAVVERENYRGKRSNHCDQDGDGHKQGTVLAYRREPHGGHADVMHPHDGKSHQGSANQSLDTVHLLPAHHTERSEPRAAVTRAPRSNAAYDVEIAIKMESATRGKSEEPGRGIPIWLTAPSCVCGISPHIGRLLLPGLRG